MKSIIFIGFCLFGACMFRANSQVIETLIEPFVREAVPNIEPVPYVHIREADVLWGKTIWRVIDMREKINHIFYYPKEPVNNRKSLISATIEGIENGIITAYTNDQLEVKLTYDELMASLTKSDSVTLTREYPPYDTYDTVLTIPFKPDDVTMWRLREFWFFDKKRSVLECRIMALCPVMADFDERGELRGYLPLFWVSYPEARQVYAKTEVFNRHSDAYRLSIDDVFYKRMFNSYIIKETNVYDRSIVEYAVGFDALLESERIKDEIFVFEHDLWEY